MTDINELLDVVEKALFYGDEPGSPTHEETADAHEALSTLRSEVEKLQEAEGYERTLRVTAERAIEELRSRIKELEARVLYEDEVLLPGEQSLTGEQRAIALYRHKLAVRDSRIKELEAALRKVRPATLADWFDAKDREKLAKEMGVTPAEVPGFMLSGMEVQRDLRAAAALLSRLQEEGEGGS